jgi:DNA adenine methylase
MPNGISKLRPVVKCYGGKHYLAKWIISQFPEHQIYLEPFGGAASVLLNKTPVGVEVYNDLNLRITNIFRVLQKQGADFAARMEFVPYSQKEFEDAGTYPPGATDLDKAVCDYIRYRQSFGGKGTTWSCTTGRPRGGKAGDVNAWLTAIDQLPEITARLMRVQFLHQPAIQAIRRFDSPETLIYCDPPYLPETREANSRDIYCVEMTEADHRGLADVLNACASAVVLSGYPSALYDTLYKNWRRVYKSIANHAAGGKTKSRKTEVLWIKDAATKRAGGSSAETTLAPADQTEGSGMAA